jgi:hypothetical protein
LDALQTGWDLRRLALGLIVALTLMFAATVAHGASYPVPPTKTGALGISSSAWKTAATVADGVGVAAGGVAAYAGLVGVGLAPATLGVSAATAAPVAAVAGAVLAGSAGLSYVFKLLSGDPPDRNFKTIFKPVLASVPAFALATKYRSVSDRLHALVTSELRVNEYVTAYTTSVNRSTGAKQAHSVKYFNLQRRAAAGFARKAGNLLLGLEHERDLLADSLTATGANLVLTTGEAATANASTKGKSLPVTVTRVLKDLTLGSVSPGIKKGILDETLSLERSLAKAKPVGGDFAKSLPDPKLAFQEAKAAGALLGYANAYG